MNRITVMGRLGHNPEVKELPNGGKVTNMNVASSMFVKGEEQTVWYKVAVFNDVCEKIISKLDKGSAVIVIGEFYPRNYQKKDGTQGISYEIKASDVAFSPFKQKREESCDNAPF